MMAHASPMISPNKSAIRSRAVEALDQENPDCEDIVRRVVVVHLDGVAVVDVVVIWNSGVDNDDGLGESTTDGEKKRCLERCPSSGNARQAAQEAGVDIAAAACSEATETCQVLVTRCQRSGTGGTAWP